MGEYKQHGADALARLMNEVLPDPSRRKAFRENPQEAANELGIPISEVPERVVAMLAKLSDSELSLLSDLNYELIEGGLKVDTGEERKGEVEAHFMAGPAHTLGVL